MRRTKCFPHLPAAHVSQGGSANCCNLLAQNVDYRHDPFLNILRGRGMQGILGPVIMGGQCVMNAEDCTFNVTQ